MPQTPRRRWSAMLGLLAWALLSPALVHAQTFKLSCDVEGKLSEGTVKVSAARVAVELQVIGRHLYFTVQGPPFYEMRVSTLVTEEFLGENLSSGTQIGARRQERRTQRETQLLIERGSMELTAHNDVSHAGKAQRFKYAGKCRQAA